MFERRANIYIIRATQHRVFTLITAHLSTSTVILQWPQIPPLPWRYLPTPLHSHEIIKGPTTYIKRVTSLSLVSLRRAVRRRSCGGAIGSCGAAVSGIGAGIGCSLVRHFWSG